MIQVMLEPESLHAAGSELCCFCRQLTNTWYPPKDVAVCVKCALHATHDDVPSKEVWCRRERIAHEARNGGEVKAVPHDQVAYDAARKSNVRSTKSKLKKETAEEADLRKALNLFEELQRRTKALGRQIELARRTINARERTRRV